MRFITALLILITSCLPALASNGQVTEYSLANGLKIIVKQDHRAPVVVSQIWYKVGSSYESTGLTGISHALEHMMFRGTKNYGPGVLKKIIAENGGDINAMTSYDYTMYYEVLAADKLPIALKLEADRMHGLLLDPKAFQQERQVIMEERRMRTQDDPQARTFERFAAAAFITSPYHHPVIGWMHEIKHFTTRDLRHWYNSWYTPNNAILVVVGDVKPNKVYHLTQKYFGPIKSRPLPKTKPITELPPLGERLVKVQASAKLPWLIMGYNVPHKIYALEVIAAILDGGDSARLSKDLIREQRIAVAAGAAYPLYARLDTLFILEGTPAPHHTIKQLKQALLQEIHQLQTTLVTPAELARVKAQVIANKIYTKDSITAQAEELGSLEVVGLPWQEADKYVQHIKAVTPEQIRTVAQKYLTTKILTIGILQPTQLENNHAP